MVDLIIIGAGPAGLSAAIAAAKNDLEVMVIDEFIKPGGRLLGQLHKEPDGIWWNGVEEAEKLYQQTNDLPIEFHLGTSVYHMENKTDHWLIQTDKGIYKSNYLLIATGAAERSVPVPGWTLPGVMSIGAAQVMANVHRVKPGQNGVIIGINVLSMAIARELKLSGVNIKGIILPSYNLLTNEGANPSTVFDNLLDLVHLAPSPLFKLGGAITNKFSFIKKTAVQAYPRNGFKAWKIPIQLRRAVVEILGEKQVEGVKVADITPSGVVIQGTEKIVEVDFVCIAGGLYPLTELIGMTNCPLKYIPSLGGHVPVHNDQMETPIHNLYVAGNITGIESAKVAKAQGTVAGLSIAKGAHKLHESQLLDDAIKQVDNERQHALIQFDADIQNGRNTIHEIAETY
ncbi:FAD-dependent oxidoreductase [Radiobacillus kanasensis]|uniref:NAD(P)/FAD-dependent oxidoreductase n=1 Tax=Radiobacillus kanasensis TaxID=2844358 RepID=UPI001E548272|nr:FAD-dependent oxidoreductase [Radiobacillus kanasensis]UFT98827.1 FAD-dependent oxidoreductase [Radiobacillus kanasensis]